MPQLSFVAVTADKDIDLFLKLTLRSVIRFFKLSDISNIHIITKATNVSIIRKKLNSIYSKRRNIRSKIKVYNEKKLLRHSLFNRKTTKGYRIQQVLKLEAHKIVDTDYYCTLDSDVYLTQPTCYNDIFSEGRAYINVESLDAHPKWWKLASKCLELDVDILGEEGIGVTPCMLNTRVCREFLEKYRTQIYNYILYKMATEYTLYWLYFVHNYNFSDFYCNKPLYGRCIWTRSAFKNITDLKRKIDKQFYDEKAIFSLVQTNLKKREIYPYIMKKLENESFKNMKIAKTVNSFYFSHPDYVKRRIQATRMKFWLVSIGGVCSNYIHSQLKLRTNPETYFFTCHYPEPIDFDVPIRAVFLYDDVFLSLKSQLTKKHQINISKVNNRGCWISQNYQYNWNNYQNVDSDIFGIGKMIYSWTQNRKKNLKIMCVKTSSLNKEVNRKRFLKFCRQFYEIPIKIRPREIPEVSENLHKIYDPINNYIKSMPDIKVLEPL